MKITSFKTKHDQDVKISNLTVLVGPNNVGKSQTLRDIHTKMTLGLNSKTKVIKKIEFKKPSSFKKLILGLVKSENTENPDHYFLKGIKSDLRGGDKIEINLTSYRNAFDSASNLDFTLGNLSRLKISFLDASSRLNVAQSANSFNPHTELAQNLLQGLFGDNGNVDEKLLSAFKEAFGMSIKLDYSGMKSLSLKIAKKFRKIPKDPREAYPLMKKYSKLDDQGDGFRSFVGVVLSLLLSEGRVILLDEPEAFLHPAQAKFLGTWISEYSRKSSSQVIVATHNSHFLSGILSNNSKVNIYRLNRKNNITKYNLITEEATKELAQSPLLSSQRVLESVFHKGVVVTEADADRSLYQIVSTKRLKNSDTLFIHAHNKQTIHKVVSLLADATIPVCSIVDIDILNDATELKRLLSSLNNKKNTDEIIEKQKALSQLINDEDEAGILLNAVEKITNLKTQLEQGEHSLSGLKGALNRISKLTSRWNPIKEGGVESLGGRGKQLCMEIIKEAKEWGLFIVPVGELENWIDLETRKKNKWIIKALYHLHTKPCPRKLSKFVGETISYLSKKYNLIVETH